MAAGSGMIPDWLAQAAWDAEGMALLFVGRAGMVRHWNRSAARLFLLPEPGSEGVPFHRLFPTSALAEAEAAHRAVSLGGTLEWQGRRVRLDGGRLWIAATWSAVLDPEGNPAGVLEWARDETERRHEFTALRSSEALLARMVDTAGDGLLAFDGEGRIVFANPAAGSLLGLSLRELLSRRFDALGWGWDSTSGKGTGFGFLAVTRTGEPLRNFAIQVRRGDGTLAQLRGEAVLWPPAALGGPGQQPGVILSLLDEASRRRAEAAETERRERELLTRRLIAVEEAERRRIAAEMHDELGATLSGLRWLLESAALPYPENTNPLAEARALAAGALVRARDLCLDLRPASLDELGLAEACRALAQRVERRSGLRVEVLEETLPTPTPEPAATAAYRIVQEALTNAARHSGASQVKVDLRGEAGLLRVAIRDDGQGFLPEETETGVRSSGLSGMRDRARVAGGELGVHSSPGSGTSITAEFPLLATAQPEAGKP